MAADLAFHEGICEASGNETLLETWRSLIGRITIMVLNVGAQRMSRLQDADAHRPLLEAIASGDEKIIRETFARVFDSGTARRARGGQPRRGRERATSHERPRLPDLARACPPGDLGELPDESPSGSRTARATASRSRARRARAASRRCWRRRTRLDVRVHRVSQGTGVALLTDDELAEMASLAARRIASR